MNGINRPCQALLAALTFLVAGNASAEWLAPDPGTKISLHVAIDGNLVIRPIGGTWTHGSCSDPTSAEHRFGLWKFGYGRDLLNKELLIQAALAGSVVNIFADPDLCDEHGHPFVKIVRVQGP